MSYFKSHFFVIFLFVFQTVYSQNKAFDDFFISEIGRATLHLKKNSNFNKAYLSFTSKDYDSSLIYSMKFLLAKNKNKLLEDYCHYFRGHSFKHKKLYDQAILEFELIAKKNSFYKEIVNFNKGEIAIEKSDFKLGLNLFLGLEKIKTHKYVNSSFIYGNIAICLIHLNKFDEAKSYLLKSLKGFEREKDTISIIRTYTNIANMYYDQYEDELAIPYFEKAYLISKKIKDYGQKCITAGNMSIVEENRKNFKKAFVYIRESQKWKDLLNDQNKIWAIVETEKKFAIQQKQKEIYLLETKNKLKIAERNSVLYALFLLILLFITGIYFYFQKTKTNKIILSQKEILDKLNSTKDKLLSIISHDLRSSVNALKISNNKQLICIENKNYSELNVLLHRNSSIVNSTYNLLDNLLNWAQQQTDQLYFEKESLHLFSVLQQIVYNYKPLVFEKNISFKTTISKDIFIFMDLDSLKIILRNILDNAIKFSKKNGIISIYIAEENSEFIHLVIEDNGIGIQKTVIEELMNDKTLLSKKENKETIGTGLGLQLCKNMLYKNEGKLSIESQIGLGTKMILILPKKKADEPY